MSTAGQSSLSRRGELAVSPSLDRASAADLLQFATETGGLPGTSGPYRGSTARRGSVAPRRGGCSASGSVQYRG
jgi:hypothetical protein